MKKQSHAKPQRLQRKSIVWKLSFFISLCLSLRPSRLCVKIGCGFIIYPFFHKTFDITDMLGKIPDEFHQFPPCAVCGKQAIANPVVSKSSRQPLEEMLFSVMSFSSREAWSSEIYLSFGV